MSSRNIAVTRSCIMPRRRDSTIKKGSTFMKEPYESPNFRIIIYETTDIIAASSSYGDNDFRDPWGKI